MGQRFHIRSPGAPFLKVEEQTLLIPRRGKIEFGNTGPKLVVVISGTCKFAVNNQPWGPVKEGDVLVLPHACRQTYLPEDSGTQQRLHVLLIMLTPEWLRPRKKTRDSRWLPLQQFWQLYFSGPRKVSFSTSEDLRFLISELRKEGDPQRPGHQLKVYAILFSLLVTIVRTSFPERGKKRMMQRNQEYLVHRAKEFMVKNFRDPLSLDDIAWSVRLSREHCARIFRKETGATVFDYLKSLRIEQAKSLLLNSEQTIADIARQVGFGTPGLFCRNFKIREAMTPKAYRAENSGSH